MGRRTRSPRQRRPAGRDVISAWSPRFSKGRRQGGSVVETVASLAATSPAVRATSARERATSELATVPQACPLVVASARLSTPYHRPATSHGSFASRGPNVGQWRHGRRRLTQENSE